MVVKAARQFAIFPFHRVKSELAGVSLYQDSFRRSCDGALLACRVVPSVPGRRVVGTSNLCVVGLNICCFHTYLHQPSTWAEVSYSFLLPHPAEHLAVACIFPVPRVAGSICLSLSEQMTPSFVPSLHVG
jgi:hypothetical protein